MTRRKVITGATPGGYRRAAGRGRAASSRSPRAGLLRSVAAGPGRSRQALATQLGLLPSRLVGLVDELEDAGRLERRRNPDDRRHHALHLTPAGQRRLADLGEVAQAHGADLLEPLSETERSELARVLGRLADHHGLAAGVLPGYRTTGPRAGGPGRSG